MTTDDAAAAIRRCADVTLTSTGLRLVEHTSVRSVLGAEGEFDTDCEGVADLAGLRCDITKTIPAAIPRMMSSVARRITNQHPWVLHEEELAILDSDEVTNQTFHNVYVGGASFMFRPDFTDVCLRLTGDPDSHRRHPGDPTWVVEALKYVDEASLGDAEVVRGIPCRRLGFHVDLERHRGDLELAHRSVLLGAPHLVGEVWVDADGLVRRVLREQIERRRKLSPTAEPQDDRRWRTVTEFWDYGLEVLIPVPIVRESGTSSLDVYKRFAVGLWRRRREYKRRTA